jgi:DNA-binding NtrC family response regulator
MATILVVDDDPDMRDVMFDVLALDGHEVVLADDGELGLQRYRNTMPDLVITDLKMPGSSGLDLLEDLSNEFANVPVIVMTGTTDVTEVEQAVASSARRILRKPFEVSRLLDAVSEMLEADLDSPAVPIGEQFPDHPIG